MEELISVIVPVYKVEKYLEKCVSSIQASTYRKLEIILVDDGSPDQCPEICDALALSDPRIRTIHKKNGGLSSARNAALDIISGKYVTFVDSDDWIAPDMIEILYRSLTAAKADISVIQFRPEREDGPGGKDQMCLYDETKLILMTGDEAVIEMCLGNKFEGHACCKLFKKNLFEQVRFPEDILLLEDMPVFTELGLTAGKIAFYPYQGYHYLQRSESLLHAPVKESDWTILTALDRMYQMVRIQRPALLSYFDFVYISQTLIFSMRLNAFGKLDRKNYMMMKDIIKAHYNVESVRFCSKGSRIRLRAFLMGKVCFTACNWVLRSSRKVHS